MNGRVKLVAAVQGASGTTVQDLFCRLIDRWPGLRIAGVVAESHGLPDRLCSAGYLRRIGTSERFAMFEDRGAGSAACHLEGSGVLAAAEAVRRDIAAGCDLVLLSKFGKLEVDGKGLWGAFNAAVEAGIPLLTSVSPGMVQKWATFATAGFTTLSADSVEIDAWIDAARSQAGRFVDDGAAFSGLG